MPARFSLPRGARPRPCSGSPRLALAMVFAVAGLAGCRPPAPADGVVEPSTAFSRPVATLGPDDAVPDVTEGSAAAPVAPAQPTRAEQMQRTIDATGKVALQIDFDTGGTNLHAGAMPVLDEIVTLLRNDPALELSIDAHTDAGRDAGRSRELTRKRAETIRAALIANGIDADRLQARGLGADHPVVDGNAADSRRNRRVELVRRD